MNACGDASTDLGDASTIDGDASTAQATIDSVAGQSQELRHACAEVETAYEQQGLAVFKSEGTRVLDITSQSYRALKSWRPKVVGYVVTAHEGAAQAIVTADATARAMWPKSPVN